MSTGRFTIKKREGNAIVEYGVLDNSSKKVRCWLATEDAARVMAYDLNELRRWREKLAYPFYAEKCIAVLNEIEEANSMEELTAACDRGREVLIKLRVGSYSSGTYCTSPAIRSRRSDATDPEIPENQEAACPEIPENEIIQ